MSSISFTTESRLTDYLVFFLPSNLYASLTLSRVSPPPSAGLYQPAGVASTTYINSVSGLLPASNSATPVGFSFNHTTHSCIGKAAFNSAIGMGDGFGAYFGWQPGIRRDTPYDSAVECCDDSGPPRRREGGRIRSGGRAAHTRYTGRDSHRPPQIRCQQGRITVGAVVMKPVEGLEPGRDS